LGKEMGFEGSVSELEKNEEFKKKILEMFLRVHKEKNLNGLEKIKGVIIEGRNWADLDLITTTFKKKRF
jgi:flagellar biosynthesis regulator FlbT